MRALGKLLVSSVYALGYFGIGSIALAAQQPNANPQVVWQLKSFQPATPTQPQQVIWQGEPLPGVQPDDVVNTTREPPRPRPEVAVARPPLSSRVHNVTVAAFTAQPATTVDSKPRQPAAPVLINYLAQKSQQWLNQWGEAEIALQSSRSDWLRGSVALLLPLKQSPQQLLFTQGGWHRDQEGTLFSLGVGQRWFYSAHSHWGCNLFVDYRRQGQHQRLGLGVEQRHSSLIWNLNGYLPLSPRRLVANRADWIRPARGLDLRLQYQPPQQPHWRVNLITERYFGTIAMAQDHTLQRNPMAVTLGVGYTPLPLVTAGYDFKLGSGRQRSYQLQLTLHYHLGVPLAHQLDPQQLTAAQSLAGNRLALVPRSRHLLLQQQPNDEIQLALQPERICQPVGSRVTIDLQLHSPRPLEEWRLEWRGDLLQHIVSPQINAAQDQASLLLPKHPVTYRLQLIARNARGVVAYSNELWVIAEAVEVPANPQAHNLDLEARNAPSNEGTVLAAVRKEVNSACVKFCNGYADFIKQGGRESEQTCKLLREIQKIKDMENTDVSHLVRIHQMSEEAREAFAIADNLYLEVRDAPSNKGTALAKIRKRIKKVCVKFCDDYASYIKRGGLDSEQTRKSLREIQKIKDMENTDESHVDRIAQICEEASTAFAIANANNFSSGISVSPPSAHNPDLEATRDAFTEAAPPGSEATAPVVPMGDQAPATIPTPAVSAPVPTVDTAPRGDETPKRSRKVRCTSLSTPPNQTPGSSSSTPGLDEKEDDWEEIKPAPTVGRPNSGARPERRQGSSQVTASAQTTGSSSSPGDRVLAQKKEIKKESYELISLMCTAYQHHVNKHKIKKTDETYCLLSKSQTAYNMQIETCNKPINEMKNGLEEIKENIEKLKALNVEFHNIGVLKNQ